MSGPYVESSDVALVGLAQAGDRAAFTALFRRHNHEIYNLALRLTQDRDSAREVVQETWIRVWRGLGSFRGDSSFSTWSYRITVNTASTWRRRRSSRATVHINEVPEPEVADETQIPDRAAENADLRRRLNHALAELKPGLRSVVVMKDVYGWSHLEIAQALEISTTAAKVRLHRAHQQLQRNLREAER
jgi:RNA polymerase sigma-70 factor (ECF subfamily)